MQGERRCQERKLRHENTDTGVWSTLPAFSLSQHYPQVATLPIIESADKVFAVS